MPAQTSSMEQMMNQAVIEILYVDVGMDVLIADRNVGSLMTMMTLVHSLHRCCCFVLQGLEGLKDQQSGCRNALMVYKV